ncbi:HotDog domain-containing protein [Mycena crocata]|nr:HotDog domain-containing protein [Mycena crocata]
MALLQRSPNIATSLTRLNPVNPRYLGTLSSKEDYTRGLEEQLQALSALQELRKRPDAADWYETRPRANLPEDVNVDNLTSGSLHGPGKLALFPLARVKRDESEAVFFLHLGRALCGHNGIVHGGLLATLMDEALTRNASMNLPEKIGVTATLSLNYRASTRGDHFVILKTRLVEARGRKATVSGQMEDLSGTVLVDAQALIIQPRDISLMHPEIFWKIIGQPPQDPVNNAKLREESS